MGRRRRIRLLACHREPGRDVTETSLPSVYCTGAIASSNALKRGGSKLAIAWRRGFFRVWVVATVLWLIAAGILGATLVNSTNAGTYAFLEDKDDVPFEFMSNEYQAMIQAKSDGRVQQVTFKDIPYVTLFVLPNSATHDIGPIVEHYAPLAQQFYETKRADNRQMVVVGVAVWAILVPLVILAIGSAIAWAFAGFASSPRRT